MKKQLFYSFLIMLSFSLMSATCSTDDDDDFNNNSAEINDIKNTVQSNTWVITSLIDSGVDETTDYNGFNFIFNSNGTLTATKQTLSYNGTWSITDDDISSDDISSDDIDFNIFFSSPANFNDDLSEDWEIVSKSATKIELIHISGGNGGTDNLIFEKK